MSTKAERLRTARIEAGFASTIDAAKRLGISPSTLRAHENGQNDYNSEQAEAYGKAYGIDPALLLFDDTPVPAKQKRVFVPSRPVARTSRIPDLEIFAGMGPGGALEVRVDADGNPTDPDQVRGYWEFPDYLLRRFGDLTSIYAWEARGDSMEPTITGGSIVFVNTRQRHLPPDDIYAVNYGDGLVVKRLKLIPRSDRVAVISDNDRYGVDELQRDEVTVWGRVIGWFQWRG